MALITTDDLDDRKISYTDAAEANAAIDDASALVVDHVKPELDDATPETAPAAVKAVVVNMVRRGLTNPRGLAQESLGDYSYSSGGEQAASIYMTRREKRIVRRAVGKLGAGTVALEGYLPLRRDTSTTDDLTGSL